MLQVNLDSLKFSFSFFINCFQNTCVPFKVHLKFPHYTNPIKASAKRPALDGTKKNCYTAVIDGKTLTVLEFFAVGD